VSPWLGNVVSKSCSKSISRLLDTIQTFIEWSIGLIRGSSNLEVGPTASSIREYHPPILVEAIMSWPVCKFRMGLNTPKTARSARFGLEPPGKKQD